jgi:hypothetical protein
MLQFTRARKRDNSNYLFGELSLGKTQRGDPNRWESAKRKP